ncbi:MAG: hypothetical protein JNM56_38005 [Planctomycetia bacterium]|nr:hypothetical protein [Planctomycetia bacterium]
MKSAVGETFTLEFGGVVSGPLSRNASALEVASALEGLGTVGAGNVAVNQVADHVWDVRFLNALKAANQPLLVGTASAAGTIEVTERWPRNPPTQKVVGQNRYDAGERTHKLLFDFDDGTAARSPLGQDLGLGNQEALIAQGDSGGPSFIRNGPAGPWEIAGVHSTVRSSDQDQTSYVNSAGRQADSSFGEIGTDIQVAPYLDGFLRRNTAAAGHVVLDMNYQVLGLDGRTEDVEITVRNAVGGGGIQIIVTSRNVPQYSGVYYQGNATALTIRGSDDHETIRFVGNLGLNSIEVVGRDGNDTVLVDLTAGDPIGRTFSIDGGAGVNRMQVIGDTDYTLSDTSLVARRFGTSA